MGAGPTKRAAYPTQESAADKRYIQEYERMQDAFEALVDPCTDQLLLYSNCCNKRGEPKGTTPSNLAPRISRCCGIECVAESVAYNECVSRRMDRLRVVCAATSTVPDLE